MRKKSQILPLAAFLPLSLAAGLLSACMQPPNSQTLFLMRQQPAPYLWSSPRPNHNNPRAPMLIGGQPIAYRRDMMFFYPQIYAAQQDSGYIVPQIPYARVNPQYLRQIVDNTANEPPGTIIVDRKRHYLYLVIRDNLAIRYGIGVGREGFSWAGRATVNRKAAWPQWNATPEMVQRARSRGNSLQRHFDGQMDNPMAARALYIANRGRDTLYRIHGTPEWWTIGKNVTSGCFRMYNQDIIDLYDRVPAGAKIVVL